MTGLDVRQDVIIEVAAIVTDMQNFEPLDSYESRVAQPYQVVYDRLHANTWYNDFPENRDTFLQNLDSGLPPEQVEQDLLALITKHFAPDEPVILAGNSIHNDRNFIAAAWPKLNGALHYRMCDVSSFKIIMQGKYEQFYEKQQSHRALGDIQESIDELKSYLQYLHK